MKNDSVDVPRVGALVGGGAGVLAVGGGAGVLAVEGGAGGFAVEGGAGVLAEVRTVLLG